MDALYKWLLEDGNPAIKYRTQKELLNQNVDNEAVKKWILDKVPASWYETNGLWYRYYVAALAECGLSKEDVELENFSKAFDELNNKFEWSCADFMLLTSLVKLGFQEHETIKRVIEEWNKCSLTDGGFLCAQKLKKFDYIPKSCYKVNLHALLFVAECSKHGIEVNFAKPLIDYFVNRNIFYRTTDIYKLVLDEKIGWRTVDVFYPFEVMRIGLQNVLEAFCALGFGDDKCLAKAWEIIENNKDDMGRVLLQGTLTKSYLPKEKVGKASKWATFYVLLAEKQRTIKTGNRKSLFDR